MGRLVYKTDYGTPEKFTQSYRLPGDEIGNVTDMYFALKDLIKKQPYFKQENDRIFEGKTKIGEMHISADRLKEMEYIPTESS